MENLESVLKEHAFLSDFPDELFPVIVGCASNVRYDTEQFIFHESEEAKKVYLIKQGKVAVEIFVPGRGHVVIETLEEVGFLLYRAFFVHSRRQHPFHPQSEVPSMDDA